MSGEGGGVGRLDSGGGFRGCRVEECEQILWWVGEIREQR